MADEAIATPADPPKEIEVPLKSNPLLETPADSPDPDEAELKDAEAAVAAEAKAADENKQPETPAAETPAATPETPASPPPPPTTVPVAAVQDERQKRQDAEERERKAVENGLYWKGVAEGRYPSPAPKEPKAPAEPSNERKTAIRAEMRDLAGKVERGELSAVEQEEARAKLEDELHDIRQAETVAAVKASIPRNNDLYLDTITAKLEDTDPWVRKVPPDELANLKPFAIKHLIASGTDFQSIAGTPIGDFRLREAIIAVGKKFGFHTQYGEASATPASPPAPPPPSTTPTEAQRREKEALAAAAPPMPSGVAAPTSTWTEDRITSMSDLDLENMSAGDLKKVGDQLDRDTQAARVSTAARR